MGSMMGGWKAVRRSGEPVAEYINGGNLGMWAKYDAAVQFVGILMSFNPLPRYWEWEGIIEVNGFCP